MVNNILAAYEQDVAAGTIVRDPAQTALISHFEGLMQNLKKTSPPLLSKLKKKIIKNFKKKPHYSKTLQVNIHGLYIWGGVGIGKSYLMDLFFKNCGTTRKIRYHFHDFMREIHIQLGHHQGEKNPLKKIVAMLSKKYDILCLDEFLVDEIADAMILANLLEALFQSSLKLVTTANNEPKNLYLNGLQRSRFLPAIKLLETQLTVHHLPTLIDYRVRKIIETDHYLYPLTEENQKVWQHLFNHYSGLTHPTSSILKICGREVQARAYTDSIIWFDFKDLCHIPRSQNDYLEIAKKFSTIFLSDVPKISEFQHNNIRYFISLIDILYDKKIKLLILAETPAEQIYTKGPYLSQFARTLSRLQQMKSIMTPC